MARVSRKGNNNIYVTKTEEVRIWNAALYVRLSVEDNGKDSDSISNQIAILEKYVSERPYLEKVDIYIDNGYTGTNFARPEYDRMMNDVKKGLVNCVIVKDLSRLGRNYIETGDFIEKICPFFGLRFISVNDDYDTETSLSGTALSVSLKNIVNDYYAKDISRKVTSALRTKMLRGDYIGNYAPYGYLKDPKNKNHLVIDYEVCDVVKRIFAMRADGRSFMSINRTLNNEGVLSPSEYKRQCGIITNNNDKPGRILWNKHMITEILSNVVYIGSLVQRKSSQCLYEGKTFHRTCEDEYIIAENTHEAIIDYGLFERVQQVNAEAAERTRANSGKYSHLPKTENLYGKKFVCAVCGRVMKLQRSFNSKKDKVYFTFKCPTYAEHGKTGCSDVKIKTANMDLAVIELINKHIELFVDMDETLKRLLAVKKQKAVFADNNSKVKSIREMIAKKEAILSTMYADLKEGFLTETEYADNRGILKSDIEKLKQELSEVDMLLSEARKQSKAESNWKRLVKKYSNITEMSAEIVEAFIEKICINAENQIEVTLKYFDEIEALMHLCNILSAEVA